MRPAPATPATIPGDRFMPVAIPGLLSAYRFRAGSPPESLDDASVAAALADAEAWVWLHFSIADKLARTYIAALPALPEPARETLLDAEDQLGLWREEGAVFGIVADFERELDSETEVVGRLRFAFTERLVVSGRRHPLRSVDEVRQLMHDGMSPAGPGALVELIVDRFCDAVAARTKRMDTELDAIEDHVVSDLVERERARIIPVRRLAVRLHRQLASLSAILREFAGHEPEEGSPMRIEAARLAARCAALDQDVLSMQDRSRLLQDEVTARLADETNRSLKALSEMTALLLPGSLVASIFGMNVHGLPFLESAGGFEVVMVVGVIATAGFFFLLRKRGG